MQKNIWIDNNLTQIKDIMTNIGTLLTEEEINTHYNIQLQNLEYNCDTKNWKKY